MRTMLSPVGLCLLVFMGFLQVLGQSRAGLLIRSKRANSFLLEEVFPGNLERECWEEVCSYEEAREVFEDHHQTAVFWTRYRDGDQCESSPCGNGGKCTDIVGGFYCTCPAPFYGETCEHGPTAEPELDSNRPDSVPSQKDSSQCPTWGPEACDQVCTASYDSFICSCLPGFRLKSDRRSCEPEVEFPCGQIPDLLQSDSLCHRGNCPWQVTVLDRQGAQLCKGAVLGPQSVLTSARCLLINLGPDLSTAQVFIRFNGQRRAFSVGSIEVHDRFSLDRHDFDLALLKIHRPLHFGPALFHLCIPTHRDFTENVLMHAGKSAIVGTNESSARFVTLDECRRKNLTHSLSNKMFCLEPRNADPQRLRPDLAGPDAGPTRPRTRDQNLQSQEKSRVGSVEKNRNVSHSETRMRQNGRQNKEKNHTEAEPGQTRTRGRNFHSQEQTTQNGGASQNGHQNPAGTGPQEDRLHQDPDRLGQGRAEAGLLPGATAVSIERGTAYLVGLLTSNGCRGDALVFTKISRHMTWLQQRLGHMSPGHMTLQVSRLPQP